MARWVGLPMTRESHASNLCIGPTGPTFILMKTALRTKHRSDKMTYYRLALHDRQTGKWSWKTTALTSLEAVFELLRCYRALLPQDRLRMFTASAKEELHEQLSQENNGLASGSVTASQFLQERNLL